MHVTLPKSPFLCPPLIVFSDVACIMYEVGTKLVNKRENKYCIDIIRLKINQLHPFTVFGTD